MILKLGIADSNKDYVARIGKVLSGYDEVEIYSYTDKANLPELLASVKLDVLLISPDMYFADCDSFVKLPIILVDESGTVDPELAQIGKVQKYQRISNVYKSVIEQYASVSGVTGSDKSIGAKVIAFWSPVGGAGKTTAAMATATKLASIGKETLYLNLEMYPSDSIFFEDKLGRGIRELAAEINNNINFEMKIQGIKQDKQPHLHYVASFDKFADFDATTTEELTRLVDVLATYGHFDYVIVDLDSSSCSKNAELLKIADQVVLVQSSDVFSAKKIQSYYSAVEIAGDFELNKCISITNKVVNGRPVFFEGSVRNVASLPMISNTAENIVYGLSVNVEMDKIVGAL